MSDYLQEIEAEYQRIRGRRGLLKPLDWDLAAKWETDGIPLHVVLRTMADIGDKFNRENSGKDQINSLRYFESAITRAADLFRTQQVGKAADSVPDPIDIHDFKRCIAELGDEVREVAYRVPDKPNDVFGIASKLTILSASETLSESEAVICLRAIDQELIDLLRSISSDEENAGFDSAGTSVDPYLRNAQISAAVRTRFSAPEITLFR